MACVALCEEQQAQLACPPFQRHWRGTGQRWPACVEDLHACQRWPAYVEDLHACQRWPASVARPARLPALAC
eukprot:scaffold4889_cov19-Tisochrysis_lutea.AAC.4